MTTLRTIIVTKAKQAVSQSLCAGLAGAGGTGMFTTGLSATGNAPATHYVSSGPISDEMAALLPCTSVTLDTEGTPIVTTTPGMPTAVPALALEAGITVTQAAVNSLYAAIDVSDQSAQEAMARLGLQMVRVSMP